MKTAHITQAQILKQVVASSLIKEVIRKRSRKEDPSNWSYNKVVVTVNGVLGLDISIAGSGTLLMDRLLDYFVVRANQARREMKLQASIKEYVDDPNNNY